MMLGRTAFMVRNETDITRVILFCDIERPLTSPLMTRINRWVSATG